MVGLGNLSDQGELVASKILGKSNLCILLSSIRPILVFLLLGLVASEFWLPGLSQKAEESRLLKQEVINFDQGYWLANSEGFSYFRSTPSKNLIEEITIYSMNSEFQLLEITKAKKATLVSGDWKLNEVEIENISEGLILEEKEMAWKTGPEESDFNLILSPKYFPLSLLKRQMSNDVSEYRRNLLALEFWRKLLQPFVALSLILLAASFIFGPMRDQKSGQRIIIGIVLAFGVNIIKSLFESISMVSNMTPFVAVIAPIVLILLIGLFLIKRTKVIS
jgi:lipopolysaccharide export system permease protein